MGAPRTQPKVYEALRMFPNQDISLARLVELTGLAQQQVRNAAHGLVTSDHDNGVEVAVPGISWRYRSNGHPAAVPGQAKPKKAKTDSAFTLVGEISDGSVVVKGDTTGKLYKVNEL